jgi:hypothetical protein
MFESRSFYGPFLLSFVYDLVHLNGRYRKSEVSSSAMRLLLKCTSELPVMTSNASRTCNSSLKYKLPDRLRLHQAQAISLRASTNIQGASISTTHLVKYS